MIMSFSSRKINPLPNIFYVKAHYLSMDTWWSGLVFLVIGRIWYPSFFNVLISGSNAFTVFVVSWRSCINTILVFCLLTSFKIFLFNCWGLCSKLTASSFNASAPRPYTVSVGNATRPPTFKIRPASLIIYVLFWFL